MAQIPVTLPKPTDADLTITRTSLDAINLTPILTLATSGLWPQNSLSMKAGHKIGYSRTKQILTVKFTNHITQHS